MLAAAVDEHRKLNLFRPAKIHQLVHCRPDRPSRIEYVIDENDDLAFDIVVEFGPVNDRVGADRREIVAVKGDVENAGQRPNAFEMLDLIAIRSASGTPRRRIPTRYRSAAP